GGALGFCGYALLREPLILLIVGMTLVALASVCFSQLFATARERFAGEGTLAADAGVTLSVVRVCFSFSWTLGPAIAATIMAMKGFTALFLTAAALYALFVIGVIRFVPFQRRPSIPSAATRIPVAQ